MPVAAADPGGNPDVAGRLEARRVSEGRSAMSLAYTSRLPRSLFPHEIEHHHIPQHRPEHLPERLVLGMYEISIPIFGAGERQHETVREALVVLFRRDV